MVRTLRVNARNDLHLPAEVLRQLNVGAERFLRAEVRGHVLTLVPVDLEPRYAPDELDALDRLHADEKPKGWIRLKTPDDVERLVR